VIFRFTPHLIRQIKAKQDRANLLEDAARLFLRLGHRSVMSGISRNWSRDHVASKVRHVSLRYSDCSYPDVRVSNSGVERAVEGVTRSVVEQKGNGVAEDLPQKPAGQVPKIFGPHSLEGVSSGELRRDGVNRVAQAAQQRAPSRGRIALFDAVGCQQRDAHAPLQLFPHLKRPVIAIPDDGQAASGLKQFWEHGKLVGVGRSHRQAGDHPRPAHSHMLPEAVEGLLEQGVLAEGGFSLEGLQR